MSTFGDAAPLRPRIWIACRACKRALQLSPLDPLIVDKPDTSHFRCQKCGGLSRAWYADPRPDGEEWEFEDRTARGR